MRKIEEFWIEFDEKPPKAPVKSFIFDVTDSLKGAVIVAFVVFCMVFRVIGVVLYMILFALCVKCALLRFGR